jgi:hypothetical protein
VTQNGKDLGKTPLTLTNVEPGSRKFTLALTGYKPQTVELEFTPENRRAKMSNWMRILHSGTVPGPAPSRGRGALFSKERPTRTISRIRSVS